MSKQKLAFLVYHRIINDNSNLSGITVEQRQYCLRELDFKSQMEYLFLSGFQTISLKQFLNFRKNGTRLPEKSILLTFDDGYASDYLRVYPTLLKYNFKATFFLITGLVGEPGMVTWQQIREMANNGMEIGSHTVTHPYLSSLDEKKIAIELKKSKEIIEDQLSQRVDLLAIPFGFEHPKYADIAAECGYKAVCTSRVGLNNLYTNPFALKRIGIKSNCNIEAFISIVNQRRWTLCRLSLSDYFKRIAKNAMGRERWLLLRRKLLVVKYKTQ